MTYEVVVNEDHTKLPNEKGILLSLNLEYCLFQISHQLRRLLKAKKTDNKDMFFIDLHFLLIAVKNCQNTLKALKSHCRNKVVSGVAKKYIEEFNNFIMFRDHFEHITDNRLDGKSRKGEQLKDPNVLGQTKDYNKVEFAGEEFLIKDIFRISGNLNQELKNVFNETKYPGHYKFRFPKFY